MKTIITIVGIVVVMGLIVNYSYQDEYVYEKEEVIVEEVVEVPEAVDVIEQARLELERINLELDAKEQELLEQRKVIDAELERLRKTRVSFQ